MASAQDAPVSLRRLGETPYGQIHSMVPRGRSVVVFVFGVETGVWGSDGTPEGTRRLLGDVELVSTAVAGDAFMVIGGTRGGETPELWRTDATPEGTTLVQTLPLGTWSLYALGTEILGQRISNDGVEVWSLVGAAGAPRRIAVASSTGGAFSASFRAIGAQLLVVPNLVGESNGAGIAFRFDRAAEQLLPLSDHNVGWLRAGPHVAYLKESCDGRTCLWRTDGTSEGTRQIASHPSPHYVVDRYVTVGDTLVYSDYTEAGQQAVWGYRPDAETSEVLRLVDAPVACAHPSFGGEICYADVDGFVADELHGTVDFSADGDELRTDGTPAETMARTSYPFRVATPFFTVHEGALFGTDSAEGAFAGLWWIDGPSDAPRELGTLPDRPYNFVNAAGRVYFSTGLSENTQIDLHRVDVPCGDPALVGTALTACRVGLAREALSCGGRGSFQRNLERKLRRAESVLDHAATAESPKSARLEKRGKRLLDRIAHQIAGKRGVRKLGAECAATVGAQVRALTS